MGKTNSQESKITKDISRRLILAFGLFLTCNLINLYTQKVCLAINNLSKDNFLTRNINNRVEVIVENTKCSDIKLEIPNAQVEVEAQDCIFSINTETSEKNIIGYIYVKDYLLDSIQFEVSEPQIFSIYAPNIFHSPHFEKGKWGELIIHSEIHDYFKIVEFSYIYFDKNHNIKKTGKIQGNSFPEKKFKKLFKKMKKDESLMVFEIYLKNNKGIFTEYNSYFKIHKIKENR